MDKMNLLTRRKLLIYGGAFLGSAFIPPCLSNSLSSNFLNNNKENNAVKGKVFFNDSPLKLWKWSKQAYFFKKLKNKKIMCTTCPNTCVLSSGDRGICRSKINLNGIAYTIAYGNPCLVNIDPVEKKPLFHYMPGSKIFSIAAAGCNFRCLNCQNWEISQKKPEDLKFYDLFPKEVLKQAILSNSAAIAYTYSEPTTFYEYMTDTATHAKSKGLGNLWISNGYINQKPLENLCNFINGANVNLKSFSNEIYKKLNGGRLKPVLETFKTLYKRKVHFEITNLVIPGYTDDEKMMKKMCTWILDFLGPDHPLHFLRFFPKYKLKRIPPTSVSLITRFRKIALDMGIRYVYVGNIANHEGNNTFCHSCGKLLIKRHGYNISKIEIKNSKCCFCNSKIPGVWNT